MIIESVTYNIWVLTSVSFGWIWAFGIMSGQRIVLCDCACLLQEYAEFQYRRRHRQRRRGEVSSMRSSTPEADDSSEGNLGISSPDDIPNLPLNNKNYRTHYWHYRPKMCLCSHCVGFTTWVKTAEAVPPSSPPNIGIGLFFMMAYGKWK